MSPVYRAFVSYSAAPCWRFVGAWSNASDARNVARAFRAANRENRNFRFRFYAAAADASPAASSPQPAYVYVPSDCPKVVAAAKAAAQAARNQRYRRYF